MNLIDLIKRFPNDDACRVHLEKVRWLNGITCPKCGHDKITRLTTRKQFTCAKKTCRYSFSATVGTIFHASHIGLQKWFLAIYLMSDAKKGVSS
jgi:transposase-like protein